MYHKKEQSFTSGPGVAGRRLLSTMVCADPAAMMPLRREGQRALWFGFGLAGVVKIRQEHRYVKGISVS
jgi:hypothetical protein